MDFLPSFIVHDLPYFSAAPSFPSQPSANIHYDLLSLLSICQQTSTDILPITWHPALQSIGEGGFGEINQSMQNVQTTFAFKRIKDRGESEEEKAKCFKAVISEVLVLQNPSVRRHMNLMDLLGLCWEIGAGDNTVEVWPVLVSQKAHLGDLRAFMGSHQGVEMSAQERLDLCVGFGLGMLALHSANIVHGDLKPENVLVFAGSDGVPVPKITDFGYSCLGADENDLIELPDPGVWAAPEWHDRPFRLGNAKKVDLYSFGLACLFVLLSDLRPEVQASNPTFEEAPLSALYTNASEETREQFGKWKREGKAQRLAVKSVRSEQGLGKDKNTLVADMLGNVLSLDEKARHLSDEKLKASSLRVHPDSGTDFDVNDALFEPTSDTFGIARSMPQLSLTEYAVRASIVRQLEKVASEQSRATCPYQCMPNAAFQLALCYKIGFGVDQDDQRSTLWLQRSGRAEFDLSNEIARVKEDFKEIPLGSGRFRELRDQGQIRTLNFAQNARERGALEQTKTAHAKEIASVERVLGDSNSVTLGLKSVFSSILRDDRCWREAEIVEGQIFAAKVKLYGPDDLESLESKMNMTSIYRNLQRLEDAERMGRDLLASVERLRGPENSDTLTAIGNLAATLLARGRLKEAEDLYLRVAEAERKALGDEHLDTAITLANLAMTYNEQGRLKEAESAGTIAVNLFENFLGPRHVVTLTGNSNLAVIFLGQGKHEAARDISAQVTDVRRQLLGNKHPQTLLSMRTLASCKIGLEQYVEAEQDLAEVLEGQMNALGEQHPATIDTMSDLAMAVSAQGRNGEAESLERKVVELSTACLGDSHPDTSTRKANLAATYRDQERWDEAEKLEVPVVEHLAESLGPDHPTTLKIMGNLALTYRGQNRLQEAEGLARRVLAGKKRVLGPEHPSAKTSVMVLMSILVSQGRVQEAREIAKNDAAGLTAHMP